MKKIILFLIIYCFAVSKLSADYIHEYTVDLYYANGVKADARNSTYRSWQIKSIQLKAKYPSLKQALKYGEPKLAYNASYLWSVGDFAETIIQYRNEHPTAEITWQALTKFVEIRFKIDLDKMVDALGKITSEATLSEQTKAYMKSVEQGHGVITVAHSQGNFFTNEAFKRITTEAQKGWMKPYLHMISVASPSKEVFNGGPHVTFDNDVIAALQSMPTTHKNPNRDQFRNALGETVDDFSVAFHGFDYYMGEAVTYTDGFGTHTVSTQIARTDIEKYIMDALSTHLNAKSQWGKAKDYGCLCKDKRIIMKHKWDTELTKEFATTKVFEFDKNGKLYFVLNQDKTGLTYARSNSRDGASIEDIEESEACYELVNYDSGRLGVIQGLNDYPQPKNGAVEVTATWDNPAIDFDLDVGWSAGVHDVKDTGCPMEHFYVDTEYDIYPGTYPIYVTHKKEEDNESALIPEKMRVMIKVPKKPVEIYDIDINKTKDLEVGHVADIHVKYIDNKPVPEIKPDPEMPDPVIPPSNDDECHVGSWCGSGDGGGGVGGGAGGGGAGGSSGGTGGGDGGSGYSCGDVPCEYKIIPYLKQLLFGPIAGADLKLYRALEGQPKTLLYTGKTSQGDTLYTAGNIEIPDSIIEQLDDDTLYLLEASGGVDIDHDDDMRVDSIPTANQGTMHLLITGKQAKEIGFKMNVLTEITYQVTQEMLETNSTKEIVDTLDDISLRLLKEKIYQDTDGVIGYRDLLYWLPTIHQDTLFADYRGMVVPLVENLFANRDISAQAYRIVYHPVDTVPVLQSKRYDIDEELVPGSIVGDIMVVDEGDSPISSFALFEEGNENFIVEENGTIVVADNARLDYETQTYYRLYVTATNNDGISKPVEILIQLHNIHDSPELINYQHYDVFENTAVGDVVLEVSFDQGTSPLQTAELFGEGNEYFEGYVHENNVSIKVANPLFGFLEHRAYQFELQVSNGTQKSKKIPFTVILKDRRDIPRLANTELNVDENATAGIVIGKINIISDGYSPIEYFKIVGAQNNLYTWPDGYFSIDKNGTIRVGSNASLDYEKLGYYGAYIVAVNAMGESKKADVQINLNNIPDTLPNCQGDTLELGPISKGMAVGTTIRSEYCNNGDSKLISGELSPNSPFEVIVAPRDGNDYVGNYYAYIKLASSLENIDVSEYNLSLSVTNATGESNKRPVHITIDKNGYIFEMHQGDLNKVLGKINTGDKTISYVGTDNGYFDVDKNGTVSRNDRENNGEYKPQYTFKVTITYDDGDTKEISVAVNVQSRILAQLSVPGRTSKIILNKAKKRAYLTTDATYGYSNSRGLVIVNIEDPYHPQIISSIVTDGTPKDIILSNDERYLYLLDAGIGLKVIDISDENNLQTVSSLEFSGKAYQFGGIDLSDDGNTLYMAHGTYGIEVIDVSDPLSPEKIWNIGFLGTVEVENGSNIQPGGYIDIIAEGNRLYSVDWNYGLQVINISDLENPINIYAESLINGKYGYSATDIHLHKEEKLISVLSTNDTPATLYSIDNSGNISKLKQDDTSAEIEVLDKNIAYSAHYGFNIYDAYNPINMIKMLYIGLGQTYGMTLDKERNIAFVANGDQGLTVVDLTGIEQPIHHEPTIVGITINIAEENLSSITIDDILGNVPILKTGDTPIMNMWTGQPKYESGGVDLDCGYRYYAQPIDQHCENDYKYFNVDENGKIYINDTTSLAYENIGNMAPFAVYAKNESGHKSNQAKVMLKIIQNPNWSLKFQRPIIKIDNNISVGAVIANVLQRKSQRRLYLFDMYNYTEYVCNTDSIREYVYDYDGYENTIASRCVSSDYFDINTNGDISIGSIPPEGNYSVNIFAIDRFGLKGLDNLKIEVLKP